MTQLCLPGVKVSQQKKIKKLKKDITPGTVFHRLTVIKPVRRARDRHIIYQCRCECGNLVNVRDNNLHSGNTQSCGCLRNEILKENGESKTYDITGQMFG
jgi:hypothetical protein